MNLAKSIKRIRFSGLVIDVLYLGDIRRVVTSKIIHKMWKKKNDYTNSIWLLRSSQAMAK